MNPVGPPRKKRAAKTPAYAAARRVKVVDDWNAAHPIGTAVFARLPDGHEYVTTTRSEAFLHEDRVPVVQLTYLEGSFALTKVRPA